MQSYIACKVYAIYFYVRIETSNPRMLATCRWYFGGFNATPPGLEKVEIFAGCGDYLYQKCKNKPGFIARCKGPHLVLFACHAVTAVNSVISTADITVCVNSTSQELAKVAAEALRESLVEIIDSSVHLQVVPASLLDPLHEPRSKQCHSTPAARHRPKADF